jgi:hypothetical protein
MGTLDIVSRLVRSVAMISCRSLILSVGALLLSYEAHAFEEYDYCYRIQMKSMNEPDDTPLRLMVYLSPVPSGFDGSGRWQMIISKRSDGFSSLQSFWFYEKSRLVLHRQLGVDFGFKISLGPAAGDMSGSGSYYFGQRQSRQRRSVLAVRIPCAQTYTPYIPPKCFLSSASQTSICQEFQEIEAFHRAGIATRRGPKSVLSVEVPR